MKKFLLIILVLLSVSVFADEEDYNNKTIKNLSCYFNGQETPLELEFSNLSSMSKLTFTYKLKHYKSLVFCKYNPMQLLDLFKTIYNYLDIKYAPSYSYLKDSQEEYDNLYKQRLFTHIMYNTEDIPTNQFIRYIKETKYFIWDFKPVDTNYTKGINSITFSEDQIRQLATIISSFISDTITSKYFLPDEINEMW